MQSPQSFYLDQRSLHLMLAIQVSVVDNHSDWVNFQYFGALINVSNWTTKAR